VRSEKEIKEEIEKYGSAEGNVKDLYGWVLEGKPRYSVAELEKIIGWYQKASQDEKLEADLGDVDDYEDTQSIEAFVKFLKDKKKVEEILND